MKHPNSAPLVMIPQKCQGCLTPGQVCHLQLLGEQGRSEGTKGAAILRTYFQHPAGELAFLNTEKACCVHCQGRTKKHNGEQEQKKTNMKLPSHQPWKHRRKTIIWFLCMCSTRYLYFAQYTSTCSIVLSHQSNTWDYPPESKTLNKDHRWDPNLQELATKEQELTQPPVFIARLDYMPITKDWTPFPRVCTSLQRDITIQ